MTRRLALLAIPFLTLSAARLWAQVPAGGEFRVNTYTPGLQTDPAVAADAAGNFVVVWESYDRGLIAGQRLDQVGAPRTPEFEVGSGQAPSVAANRSGAFVVAWHDWAGGGDPSYQVYARLFDREGLPSGPAFPVNTYTTSHQILPSVATDEAGNFVVAWQSYRQDGSHEGVFAQRFDPSGATRGPEFQVNSSTTGQQRYPTIACDAGGGFAVTWEQGGSGLPFGRRFNTDGLPYAAQFQVATYSGAYVRSRPAVAADSAGNFVVAWQSEWQDEPWGAGISAQRYDATGSPVGPQFHVNTYTSGPQYSPAVALDSAGSMLVVWDGAGEEGGGIFGQRYDSAGFPRGGEFRISTYTSGSQLQPAVALDGAGNILVAWTSYGQDARTAGIYAQRFGGLVPAALRVDAYPSGYSDGNDVLEQTEAVGVWTWWRNVNGQAQTFDGEGLSFTGPAGAVSYVLGDVSGAYGTVLNGATAACSDCYALGVTSGVRPAAHWDATFTERLTPDVQGQTKLWSIHVGESFVDVPRTSPYYRYVETLLHKGVTGGCSADSYCPVEAVTREQLAVFVLAGKEGAGYLPQACTTPVFGDVPATSPYCRFIADLSRRGVVGGCGGGNYCPTSAVTREQMPVFVLKTLDPYIDPPACGAPMFADVPASSPFCRWIHELARRGVVSGCGGGNYCPSDVVTREQMAVFISGTFGFSLYGP